MRTASAGSAGLLHIASDEDPTLLPLPGSLVLELMEMVDTSESRSA
jgi:hypothetical protein